MIDIKKRFVCIITSAILAFLPSAAVSAWQKDEIVYAKLNANGSVNYITVTEQIINALKANELFDMSILDDIENLSSVSSYKLDGEKITWNTDGKDVFYRGTTTKELPVSLKITYKLNGEEKAIDDILGESGHIEIALKYTNHSYRYVDIEGQNCKIYTPFMAALATTFDTTTVSNFEITGGKALTNGHALLVAGVAAPGLYESLGLDELEKLDQITMSFDTENFALPDLYSVITPKLVDSDELQVFSQLDELYSKMSLLSDGSQQLADGAKEVKDVIVTARQKVSDAKTKITQIESKIEELKAKIDVAEAKEAAAKIRAKVVTQLEEAGIDTSMLSEEQLAKLEENICDEIKEIVPKIEQDERVQKMISEAERTVNDLKRLVNGVEQISDAVIMLNDDGIQPLVKFVNGTVRVTAKKIEILMQLADEYNSFAGVSKGNASTTKFILMVDAKRK